MALDRKEVRKIAHLARLDLTAAEEELFTLQLAEIVGYIDQLAQFATASVSDRDAASAPEEADHLVEGMDRELFLAGAPAAHADFIQVPPVKVVREDQARE